MSSDTPTPPTTAPPEVVTEADKPFFLVLILLASVIGLLLFSLYEKVYDQDKDVISILTGILASGFGFYFRTKASQP